VTFSALGVPEAIPLPSSVEDAPMLKDREGIAEGVLAAGVEMLKDPALREIRTEGRLEES